MNDEGFRAWLEANYGSNTVATKLSEARQLAKAYGDLDALYDEDGLASLMESLRYSAADKAENRPNPSKVPLTSDLNRDLSNLRTTVNYYRSYRGGETQIGLGGGVMTDDEILQRFSGKPGFKEWCAGWSAPDRAAFFRVARALHDAGVDWYHVNLERQVRCGRKKKNALDANEVFMVLSTVKGSCWVRKAPDRAALGLPESGVSLSQFADAIEAHPEALDRFIGGTAYWPDELSLEVAAADEEALPEASAPTTTEPTNLILYGPPGTGKTFATAAEAVRLCGEIVPIGRLELMARYDALVAERRIAFVTFHQSFTYEDFVEGLRPVVPIADSEASNAGFSLQAEPGIFRQIAERAQTARASSSGSSIDLTDRPVYKMSLGEVADSASDFVFKEAMAEGYALLGFNNIDWSDPRFEEREEIYEAVRERFPDRELTPNKGVVRSPDVFRNQLQIGDVVIVAKGNYKFRAIGVVEGDYEYYPRTDGRYCHRRKVNWLWQDSNGRDISDIYPPRFTQSAIYRLKDTELDRPALAALIAGQSKNAFASEPLPHVLIIDEINRANISKVFGELITLLEPDKRLGKLNALTVRLPYSKRDFGVPANLHIVGTMNTADRSIAQLDIALRRRFTFRELEPDAGKLPEMVGDVPIRRVLEVINDRIEYLIDREHRIGHAFFIGDGGRDRTAIDATMQGKVIPLLQEYFFEDWSRVATVLGERPGRGGAFLACRKLRDPTGGGGEDRESWSVLTSFAADAYDRLIGKAPDAPDAANEEASE
jgi:5-methylcytosine-specific restriction enzyme B